MSKETSNIVRLASYKPRTYSPHYDIATIWEAARATSAASSFFDSISIGPYREKFIDGATGANNPIQDLWLEAKQQWYKVPLESNIDCLVSIGTGIPTMKPFGPGLKQIGTALLRIATDTEQVHENFQKTHDELDTENRYYRLNVRDGLGDIGLEKASEVNVIAAATKRYIQSQDVVKQMQRLSTNFEASQCGLYLDSSTRESKSDTWLRP